MAWRGKARYQTLNSCKMQNKTPEERLRIYKEQNSEDGIQAMLEVIRKRQESYQLKLKGFGGKK